MLSSSTSLAPGLHQPPGDVVRLQGDAQLPMAIEALRGRCARPCPTNRLGVVGVRMPSMYRNFEFQADRPASNSSGTGRRTPAPRLAAAGPTRQPSSPVLMCASPPARCRGRSGPSLIDFSVSISPLASMLDSAASGLAVHLLGQGFQAADAQALDLPGELPEHRSFASRTRRGHCPIADCRCRSEAWHWQSVLAGRAIRHGWPLAVPLR